MRRFFWPKNIRGKLILAFLVAVAPVLCLHAVEQVGEYLDAKRVSLMHQRDAARLAACYLGGFVKRLAGLHRAWADELMLRNGSVGSLRSASRWLTSAGGDGTRTEFVATPGSWFPLRPGRTAESHVTDLTSGADGPEFQVTTPVRSAEGRSGYLVTTVYAGAIVARLPDVRNAGMHCLCALLDSTGKPVLVVSKRHGLVRRPGSYWQEVFGAHSGSDVGEWIRGGAQVKGTRWRVAIVEKPTYAFGVLRAQRLWLAGSALATLFGLVVVSMTGTRLGHRVRRLALAASAVAVGDYRKRVNMKTGDELQMLANSFNALGDSLLAHDDSLRSQTELLSRMVEAARIASSSLDIDECGRAIAKVTCTHLGAKDATVFLRRPSDGSMRVIGHCGRRCRSSWRLVARHAADSGDYLLISERAPAADQTDEAEAFLVGVPMSGPAGTVGTIVARFEGSVPRTETRMGSLRADMMLTFGAHAAAAIANAEAHLATRAAAEKLQESVEVLSSVVNVTDAVAPRLTIDETLDALARSTVTLLNADMCAIYLPDGTGNLVIRSSCRSATELEPVSSIPIGQAETGKAFALKRTVTCCDLTKSNSALARRLSEQSGVRGLVSSPLMANGEAIGALSVSTRQPRKFTPRQIELLESVARHVAFIVRNAGLYSRESTIAEALQSNLLSETPDECRGLQFASRYMPVLDEARIGGDFYEVTPLPNGKVGVLIADVSGKGLQAAMHLAACKYMIKALMFANQDDPAAVLTQLNDALNYYFDLRFYVTAFYGVIDPEEGVMSYASAGHLPGLLIHRGRKMHTCLCGTGTPVGSGCGCQYGSRTVQVGQQDILLLYTDGVTDWVKDGESLGVEGLHRIVFEAGPCTAAGLVNHICVQLSETRGAQQRDDVALLAISFEGVPSSGACAVGGEDEFRVRIPTGTN